MSECILLAGGLGTRMRGDLGDLPKSMAPIGDRPFLSFVLDYLKREGIQRIIVATGYKNETVESWLLENGGGFDLVFSVESEPLGTGGALRMALDHVKGHNAYALNADTYFDVSLTQMLNSHRRNENDLTIALKPMSDFTRYGTVQLDGERVVRFEEKRPVSHGLINGGVYVLRRDLFTGFPLPEKFSFETDFIQENLGEIRTGGFLSEGYFIDIGLPEDYRRAQSELPTIVRQNEH